METRKFSDVLMIFASLLLTHTQSEKRCFLFLGKITLLEMMLKDPKSKLKCEITKGAIGRTVASLSGLQEIQYFLYMYVTEIRLF